jgi:hypothetical protein
VALRWSALAIVVLVCARTAWRVHESAELIRLSEALQRSPAQPSLQLHIVGDSTAVGTGATAPEASLAGLLGQHFPGLQIVNRARSGRQGLARRAADPAGQAAQGATHEVTLPNFNQCDRLDAIQRRQHDRKDSA